MTTETLETIADALEAHTPAIDQIAGRRQPLEQLFQAVEARWQKESTDLDQTWNEAQQALNDAASTIESLVDSVKKIESTMAGLQHSLDTTASDLKSLIADECMQATTALDGSQNACEQFGTRIDADLILWNASVVAAHGELDQAAQFLESRFDEVNQAARDAGNALGASHAEFVATVATQRSELETTVSGFSTSFSEEHLVAAVSVCKATADRLALAVSDQLVTPMSAAVTEATNSIERAASGLVDRAADGVGECIDQVTQSLTGATSESSGTREAMVPLREQLKPIIEPLEDVVDAVGALAGSLGVH